jgi:hypothetical protein
MKPEREWKPKALNPIARAAASEASGSCFARFGTADGPIVLGTAIGRAQAAAWPDGRGAPAVDRAQPH